MPLTPDRALVLRANAVTKSYGGVRALKGVSFDLRRGEVHALVGENGAGKSTLLKVIAGAVRRDGGDLVINGESIANHDPASARALGIAVVYQQPALFPGLTVAENIALALEPPGLFRRVNWRRRRDDARRLLAQVSADIRPDTEAAALSMPEQQLVEIAKALGAGASIFILDEPTASLTATETARLLSIVDGLRSRGAAIIYISHRLEEIARIADRITVLRDGESVATLDAVPGIMGQVVNLLADCQSASPANAPPAPLPRNGPPCLSVHNLHGITFDLHSGEILGFAGLIGSGRTELARTLFGITPATSGSISIDGREASIRSPRDAIAAGIAYVPEDRRKHGVILDLPISANISLASLDSITTRGLLNRVRERAAASTLAARLHLKAASLDDPAATLSGGNQQKVALARWLATNPRILILDEPTQGVDIGAKAAIHSLITELAASGLAVMLISSDMEEILALSDRIAIMRQGTLAAILPRSEATEQRILSLAFESRTGSLPACPRPLS